ncbi:MAG: helix-turn-helix transcriptional regulator [Phycisphaerales bacterium]|nr:helix-turn-helix transcriptional regulator [Phycisphaerales bacterium]
MASDVSMEKSDILQLFSKSVESILESRGLKQIDLAKGIGTDARNVSNWLNLKAIPNAIWVVKMADYLGISLDELFGRKPPGGDRMPQIRTHAEKIYKLAGGVSSTKKHKKKPGKQGQRKKK